MPFVVEKYQFVISVPPLFNHLYFLAFEVKQTFASCITYVNFGRLPAGYLELATSGGI